MKKISLILFALLGFALKSQTVNELSESFLNKMLRGSYDSCRSYFDASVLDKINPQMIQSMWEKIPNYVGEFKSYENVRSEKQDTLEIVLMTCAFEKTKLDLKLVYNTPKKIVGIFFQPVKSKAVYNVPEYYRVEKLYETKLELKTGDYKMPGMLCVPNNTENPPVVIFVHGSGPNDKDETLGPNKVFKDLALGLASNGIASYRYDKRTLAEAQKMSTATDKLGLEEEVIEDVLSAVKLLRSHPTTKASKIYVAGHSLGAMCAPLIAKKGKDISGIIMLAGPARPFEDLLLEQFTYLFKLDSIIDADEKKSLTVLEEQIKKVKDPKQLKSAKASELPLGQPSYYWQSIKKYNQVQTAKGVKQPILVLQGKRDYQVTMADFEIWKKELENNPKNKFVSYEGLNHLFIKGEGVCTPSEYQVSGNVQEQVIKDICDWIKAFNK